MTKLELLQILKSDNRYLYRGVCVMKMSDNHKKRFVISHDWCLTVVAMYTFLFIRTSLTAFTLIDRHCTDVAIPVLAVTFMGRPEFLSV